MSWRAAWTLNVPVAVIDTLTALGKQISKERGQLERYCDSVRDHGLDVVSSNEGRKSFALGVYLRHGIHRACSLARRERKRKDDSVWFA